MVSDYLFPQTVTVNMGINLGGSDAFMPQHALNRPQIRPALQQMGGKGMAERVRTDLLFYADLLCQLLYYMKHHNAGNVLAPAAYKYKIFISGQYFGFIAEQEIILQFADRPPGTYISGRKFISTLIKPSFR